MPVLEPWVSSGNLVLCLGAEEGGYKHRPWWRQNWSKHWQFSLIFPTSKSTRHTCSGYELWYKGFYSETTCMSIYTYQIVLAILNTTLPLMLPIRWTRNKLLQTSAQGAVCHLTSGQALTNHTNNFYINLWMMGFSNLVCILYDLPILSYFDLILTLYNKIKSQTKSIFYANRNESVSAV